MKETRIGSIAFGGTIAFLALVALCGSATAAPAPANFGILAKSGSAGSEFVGFAGNTKIVLGPEDGTETPGGGVSFDVPEVAAGISWSRKSGLDEGNQPALVFPSVTIKAQAGASPKDWQIVLDKTQSPFDLVIDGAGAVKSGLPGWVKVEDKGDKIVLSNNHENMRLGGSNSQLNLGTLEFYYNPETYSPAEVSTSWPSVSGVSAGVAQGTLRIATADPNERVYGKWSARVDASALKTQAAASDGNLVAVGSNKDDFTIEKLSADEFLVTYTGTNQNYYIRGVDSKQEFEEQDVTGYALIHSTFQYNRTAGSSSNQFTGTASNGTQVIIEGKVALDNARKYTVTYVQVPGNGVSWSVDIDLAPILNIDPSKTPVIYNNQFTLNKKSGTTYTLRNNGTGWPVAGGTVDIQLPW